VLQGKMPGQHVAAEQHQQRPGDRRMEPDQEHFASGSKPSPHRGHRKPKILC
jgi:hypothetical protein